MGAWNAIPTLPAGHVPTAAELEKITDFLAAAPEVLTAYKTADESIASSIAPQNDDHLVIAVAASATYKLEGWLWWTSTSTTPDFRFDFTTPAGSSLIRGFLAQPVGNTTSVGTVDTGTSGPGDGGTDDTRASINGNITGILYGSLVTGGSAGSLQLRWAQVTSDAAAVVLKAGSWMRLTRIA